MATKKLEVLITGNAKAAQKAFGDLERSASTSGKKTESSLSKVQQGLVGLGVGAAVWGAFTAFDDAQKVMAQTEAVIKSTGGAANVTAGQVESLAGALSKKTGIDDEAIQSGQNLLLTFTGIRNEVGAGNDIFNQATAAALDMSTALGQDMSSASQTVGKALNDPVAGLTRLTKIGVVFTDQQKQQIRALAESGDKLGAQKVILAELNREFGGSAEAQKTALGSAKVAVDNMAESVGGALAPALETGADALAVLADGFSALPSGVQTATLGLGALGVAAVKWGPGAVESAKKLPGLLDRVSTRAFDAAGNLDAMGGKLTKIGKGIGVAAAGVAAFELTTLALERMAATGADLDAMAADLEQLGRGVASVGDVTASMNTDLEGLAAAFGKVEESPRNLGEAIGYLGTHINSDLGGTKLVKAQDRLEELDRTLAGMVADGNVDGARVAFGEMSAAMLDQGVSAEQVASAMPGYFSAIERAERETGSAATTSDRATASFEAQATSLATLERRATDATNSIKSFYDTQTTGLEASVRVEESIDNLTASFAENGTELRKTEPAGRANIDALVRMKDAAVEAAMATRDQTQDTALAAQELTGYSMRMAEAMLQAGYTEDEVAVMIHQMGLTPSQIRTTFETNATAQELKTESLRAALNRLPGFKGINVSADTSQASANLDALQAKLDRLKGASLGVGLGAPKPRAKGGPVKGGQTYLVGEQGPELFTPGGSGSIIPNHKLGGGMSISPSGGGAPVYLIVQVQGSVVAEREMVEVVRDGLIEVRRRTGRDPLAVSG